MTLFRLSCIAACAALVVACGGSGDSGPRRGELIEPAATLTTLSTAQIDGATAASGLQTLTGAAVCDVKVVALNYATVGAKAGENTNASGVMLLPSGAAGSACATNAAPLLAYARGTDVNKSRNLANPQDPELPPPFRRGYAVVATDTSATTSSPPSIPTHAGRGHG